MKNLPIGTFVTLPDSKLVYTKVSEAQPPTSSGQIPAIWKDQEGREYAVSLREGSLIPLNVGDPVPDSDPSI